MADKLNHLFCFGAGYCAQALMTFLPGDKWHLSGSTRSAPPADPVYRPYLFNGKEPMRDASRTLQSVTHLLVSIAPDETGDPVLAHHADDIRKMPDLEWVGYLSTTGVYGDTGGRRVDEQAPVNPSSKRSRNRLKAETAWARMHSDFNLPVHIFRLPGIYGPGRSALDQVKAGKARRIDKPGHKFSRIHVDDIARTLAASINNPNPGQIYNVCDDEAAAPADVTAYACQLLGVAPPDAIPYDMAQQNMSPMALSFWQDNRRVDNALIKSELGVKLAYPTYREGLDAIHALSSN